MAFLLKAVSIAAAGLFASAAAAQTQSATRLPQADQAAQDLTRGQLALAYQDRDSIAKNGIVFRTGDTKMLVELGMREIAARVEKAPGDAAKKTTIFVASADVASLPGPEAVAFVKGPVTCGRLGCKLVIVGLIDGKKVTLLETLGETVDAPSLDKLIVNKGTEFEVTWTFDGERFVEQ